MPGICARLLAFDDLIESHQVVGCERIEQRLPQKSFQRLHRPLFERQLTRRHRQLGAARRALLSRVVLWSPAVRPTQIHGHLIAAGGNCSVYEPFMSGGCIVQLFINR